MTSVMGNSCWRSVGGCRFAMQGRHTHWRKGVARGRSSLCLETYKSSAGWTRCRGFALNSNRNYRIIIIIQQTGRGTIEALRSSRARGYRLIFTLFRGAVATDPDQVGSQLDRCLERPALFPDVQMGNWTGDPGRYSALLDQGFRAYANSRGVPRRDQPSATQDGRSVAVVIVIDSRNNAAAAGPASSTLGYGQ